MEIYYFRDYHCQKCDKKTIHIIDIYPTRDIRNRALFNINYRCEICGISKYI